jgi:hypothetical protein
MLFKRYTIYWTSESRNAPFGTVISNRAPLPGVPNLKKAGFIIDIENVIQ